MLYDVNPPDARIDISSEIGDEDADYDISVQKPVKSIDENGNETWSAGRIKIKPIKCFDKKDTLTFTATNEKNGEKIGTAKLS